MKSDFLGLVVTSVLHFIKNPLRHAVLYPWLILTVEDWARAKYHVTLPELGLVRYLGIVPIAVGALVCLLAMGQFIVDGQGTPEEIDQTQRLMTAGVFRWTRNPLYVGMALLLLGEILLFESVLLILYALYRFRQFRRYTRREERRLLRQFGAPYDRYCQSVPRWLPGLPGSSALPVGTRSAVD